MRLKLLMRNACAAVAITASIAFLGGCASNQVGDSQPPVHRDEHNKHYASGELPQLPVLDQSSALQDYLKYAALNNPGLEATETGIPPARQVSPT